MLRDIYPGRPGPEFCQLIDEITATCNPKENAGLNSVNAAYQHLLDVYVILEPHMRVEEDKRPEFQLSIEINEKIRAAEHKVSEVNATLQLLEVQFNADRDDARDKKRKVSELADQERGKLTLAGAKRIEKSNARDKELDVEYKKLDVRARQLDIKISTNCCNFFACCIKAELIELKDIERQQILINAQREEEIKASIPEEKPKINESEQWATIDKMLEEKTKFYADKTAETKKMREAAKNNLIDLQLEYKQKKSHYYSHITSNNMVLYQKTYDLFVAYETEIENLWTTMRAKKAEPSVIEQNRHPTDSFVVVIRIRKSLADFHKKLKLIYESFVETRSPLPFFDATSASAPSNAPTNTPPHAARP